jgi:hypothetical protein
MQLEKIKTKGPIEMQKMEQKDLIVYAVELERKILEYETAVKQLIIHLPNYKDND